MSDATLTIVSMIFGGSLTLIGFHGYAVITKKRWRLLVK